MADLSLSREFEIINAEEQMLVPANAEIKQVFFEVFPALPFPGWVGSNSLFDEKAKRQLSQVLGRTLRPQNYEQIEGLKGYATIDYGRSVFLSPVLIEDYQKRRYLFIQLKGVGFARKEGTSFIVERNEIFPQVPSLDERLGEVTMEDPQLDAKNALKIDALSSTFTDIRTRLPIAIFSLPEVSEKASLSVWAKRNPFTLRGIKQTFERIKDEGKARQVRNTFWSICQKCLSCDEDPEARKLAELYHQNPGEFDINYRYYLAKKLSRLTGQMALAGVLHQVLHDQNLTLAMELTDLSEAIVKGEPLETGDIPKSSWITLSSELDPISRHVREFMGAANALLAMFAEIDRATGENPVDNQKIIRTLVSTYRQTVSPHPLATKFYEKLSQAAFYGDYGT